MRQSAPMAHLTPTLILREGDRDRRLMDIQPDKYAILHQVSLPFLRQGASQSGATLERRMPQEKPPAWSVHTAIIRSGKHIRTTNPIESTFATVRHRTTKTKGCLSRQTALAMTHQLMMSAKKKWRKLDGQNRLPEIIQGVEFRDGIKHETKAA